MKKIIVMPLNTLHLGQGTITFIRTEKNIHTQNIFYNHMCTNRQL